VGLLQGLAENCELPMRKKLLQQLPEARHTTQLGDRVDRHLTEATLATLFDTIALRCVLEEVPRFLRPESVDACPDLRIHFKAIVLLTESHELDRIVEAGLGIPGGGYTREVEEDIEDLSWGIDVDQGGMRLIANHKHVTEHFAIESRQP